MHYILDRAQIDRDRALAEGDDETDESAFAALPGAITVRVGDQASAAGSAARYRLENPAAVAGLLAWLAGVEPHDAGPAIGGNRSSSRGGE
jgi:trehalose-6-phosphatase